MHEWADGERRFRANNGMIEELDQGEPHEEPFWDFYWGDSVVVREMVRLAEENRELSLARQILEKRVFELDTAYAALEAEVERLKKAAESNLDICGAASPGGRICNRPPGHSGLHEDGLVGWNL